MTDRIELYHTHSLIRRHGGWRWRYVAANGHVMANGGESYTRRIDALNGAMKVTASWPTDPTQRTGSADVTKLTRTDSRGAAEYLRVVEVDR